MCILALTFRSFHHFLKHLGNCVFGILAVVFTPSFVIYCLTIYKRFAYQWWPADSKLLSSFFWNIPPPLTCPSTPKGKPSGRNAKRKSKSLCLPNLIFVFNFFRCQNNMPPKDILLNVLGGRNRQVNGNEKQKSPLGGKHYFSNIQTYCKDVKVPDY